MSKRYSLTETAKLIRTALKAAFPDTKFSVKSSSYSMGCSISVRYTDGPLTKDVDAILGHFEGAEFDGMQDLKSYRKAVLFLGEETTFGVDYVSASRSLSDAVYNAAALRVQQETGLPLITFANGRFENAEYQIDFTYDPAKDKIYPGKSWRIAGGEWYSQFLYQIAHNTTTPHQTGTAELPVAIEEKLEQFKPQLASVN